MSGITAGFNDSRCDLLARAVATVQYGPEPLEWETVLTGLATEKAEAFFLETERAVSCTVVFWEPERAQIGLFYREGSPFGLAGDMRRLMGQMVKAFRQRGIVNVYAQVECANENAQRLLSLYRQVSGFSVNSVLLHATVEGLENNL